MRTYAGSRTAEWFLIAGLALMAIGGELRLRAVEARMDTVAALQTRQLQREVEDRVDALWPPDSLHVPAQWPHFCSFDTLPYGLSDLQPEEEP